MTEIQTIARGVIMTSAPGFGGYILFGDANRSGTLGRSVTLSLSKGDTAIVAVDQEGGRVARLRDGVEPMPPMMALGAADDIELARRAGEQIAFDVRRAGCTMDFAPVLDLAVDPRNTVIGIRSFGADPQKVAALGSALARGLQQGGVIPCYKHFPGHGATEVDSHEALPTVDVDESTLRARDLLPFAAVARDAPAMMSGHVVVRALDPEHSATLSRRIITDLLRGELGFRGALVTDCLEMNAVSVGGSMESALQALVAGADLLLFSHDPELASAAADAIERAVNDGRLPLERLEEACARVTRLREAGAAPLPQDAFPPHPGLGREIARRAITLIRGVPHADPLDSIAVVFGSDDALLDREAPVIEELHARIDPPPDILRAIDDALARSQRRPILLSRRAHLHPAQADAIRSIVDRYPDAVVVSLLEPFDLPLFNNARHVLATYGDDEASIGGLADVLFSDHMPTGQLPVSLPSLSR